jgi:hypothetical protein
MVALSTSATALATLLACAFVPLSLSLSDFFFAVSISLAMAARFPDMVLMAWTSRFVETNSRRGRSTSASIFCASWWWESAMASVELTIFCHGTEKMLYRSAMTLWKSHSGSYTPDLTTHPVDACAPASSDLARRAPLLFGVPIQYISNRVACSPRSSHAPAANLQYWY